MENLDEHSEQEAALRALFSKYEFRVITLAQRAVFLPHMWAEGVVGNEAQLTPFQPELSELIAEFQKLKDNDATLIGVSRAWFYYNNEQEGVPLEFPEGETCESLEAIESLATADFMESLTVLRGLPDTEKDKLLMLAARGSEPRVWFTPKYNDQQPGAKIIDRVPAYIGVKFENRGYPIFSDMLRTCTDLIYDSVGKIPGLRDAEMIIRTDQG